MNAKFLALSVGLFALIPPPACAQIAIIRDAVGPAASEGFQVSDVEVNADINDQVATVQIAQTFQNITSRTLETQFVFPLPEDAAINGLTLVVDGQELTGELKAREEARKIYEEIVRRQRDPALLEYMGRGVFKTSVFPIPAGKSRRVEIRYTQLLKNDNGLVDFTLPLGNARHCRKAVKKMKVTVRIKCKDELKNVYSPTHDFKINQPNDHKATCTLSLTNVLAPDDVRLLYGIRGNEFGMNLVTFKPDGDEQGYFLLLASPKVKAKKKAAIPKTVMFVVDRSGSMAGQKLEQAKASLRYMINSLGPKDTFNIVSYSSEVESFKPEIELVNPDSIKEAMGFVDDLYSGGGTNIDQALTTTLQQLTDKQRPNYVLFFTDGLPTVGQVQESRIASSASKANKANARIFSFGVGFDVNSRLLDRLSRDQRGTSVYVKPEENIEIAATNLFRKVSSPAMTSVDVQFTSENSQHSGKLVTQVYPKQLPDLFFGEQLVLVGRYKSPADVSVQLTGEVADKSRQLKLESNFGNAKSTRRNGFVQTLWATRRIGQIIDELDLNGRNKELIDELVSLSLKHGIMTPYTSFLAEEDVSFGDRMNLLSETEQRSNRGLGMSSGMGGFVQRNFKQSLQNANRVAAPSAEASLEALMFKKFESGQSTSSGRSPGGAGGGYGGNQTRGGRPMAIGGGGGGLGASSPASATGGTDIYSLHGDDNVKSTATKRRIKRIGVKTFFWKANAWYDSELSALKTAATKSDVTKIEQFSDAYFKLSTLDGGRWAQYLVNPEPTLVRIKDKTYRIEPADE